MPGIYIVSGHFPGAKHAIYYRFIRGNGLAVR